jgi:branched-chain amino acid transport system permease protein
VEPVRRPLPRPPRLVLAVGVGAALLGALQQAATVTISSALNLWIVGWMLVLFVALAPRGILGWFRGRR